MTARRHPYPLHPAWVVALRVVGDNYNVDDDDINDYNMKHYFSFAYVRVDELPPRRIVRASEGGCMR